MNGTEVILAQQRNSSDLTVTVTMEFTDCLATLGSLIQIWTQD
jgi:hypothetical protein